MDRYGEDVRGGDWGGELCCSSFLSHTHSLPLPFSTVLSGVPSLYVDVDFSTFVAREFKMDGELVRDFKSKTGFDSYLLFFFLFPKRIFVAPPFVALKTPFICNGVYPQELTEMSNPS